jgi:hypothetical protein
MNPEELSEQLRRGTGGFLKQRRKIASLALAAAGWMSLISLYQTDVIKSLSDSPLPYFDSEKVNAGAEAYSKLSMPDAPIGLGSYVATLGLAAMGGQAHRWISGRASGLLRMVPPRRRLHLASVLLALPEARAALHRIMDRA